MTEKNKETWQELARKFGQSSPKGLILNWYYRDGRTLVDMAPDLGVTTLELAELMEKLNLPLRDGEEF